MMEPVDRTKGMSIRALACFTWRHLCRFSLRSFLALLAMAGFLAASCWLWNSVQSGEREADRLYLSTVVDAQITTKDSAAMISGNGGAYIGSQTVQEILDTGFVKNYTLIAGCDGTIGKPEDGPGSFVMFTGIEEVEKSLPKIGDAIRIQYGDGYGPELFGADYAGTIGSKQQTETPVIFLPDWMAENLGVSPGETLQAGNSDGSVNLSAELGGVYTGGDAGVLAPMSVLKALGRGNISYKAAEFSIDPEKNRELEEFRQKGKEIVEAPDAGEVPLSLVIWDGELRRAVEPMERNIILMKTLYPIANVVSFFAAFGLSILFLFQRRREAAILRILGIGNLVTRTMLALELLVIDLAGLLLGAGIYVLLTDSAGFSAFLAAAGCYFSGCLLGSIAGSVLVTHRSPLELLQEKE